MEEIWKEVPGWEGYYEASNLGNIRRMKNQRMLKPKTNKGGYLYVGLTRNNKTQWFFVHRLIASAFLPNPGNLPFINHKSEVKTDNSLANLEWCDTKYNNNYGTRNERISERNKATSNKKAVQQCDMDGNVLAVYESQKEAERATGIAQRNISNCCRGLEHHLSVGGYKWKFVS